MFHTPEGGSKTTTLNEQGQLLRIDQAGSAPLLYAYDSESRLKSITHGEGADARQWRYEFNPAERSVITTDPLGKKRVLSFDRSGHTTALTTPGGNKVAAERNELEQVTTFSPPGRSATRWSYRQDGLVDMMTLPAGADGLGLTTYGYDKDSLVTEVKQADGNGVTVKRDGAGRIKQVETHPGAWGAEYDPKTGLTTQLQGAGETVTLAYDGSQIISETWSGVVSAKLTREFDGQGRVVAENIGESSKVEYRYDQAGRLIQAGELTIMRNPSTGQIQSERLGTLERTWQYNTFGEVVGTAITSAGKPIYKLTVGRDKLGRILERVEQLPNGKIHKRTFSYDKEDRLASFQDNHGPITKYAYDLNGNLVRESSTGKAIEATYDGQDKLIRHGTNRYEYDSAGRLAASATKTGKTSYEYDRAGHLLSVTLPSGKKVSYAIDGQGRRIGRSIDGKLTEAYVYADALRPVGQLDRDGKLTSRFVYTLPQSSPTYFTRNGKFYLLVTDGVGTPRLTLDAATGTVHAQFESDPWGRMSQTGNQSLPFGLAGGLADSETGLLRFGTRDYDPVTTHRTAPDPLGFAGGDTNPFRYVSGDPVNRIDPFGTCDVMTVGGTLGCSLFGVGGTFGGGLATGGTDLGMYGSRSYDVGMGGPSEGDRSESLWKRFGGCGGSIQIGCQWVTPGTNAWQSIEGNGYSIEGGYGVVFGYDQSQNPDGSTSSQGFHLGAGPKAKAGVAYQPSTTKTWCWTCSDKTIYEPTPWPRTGPYAYRPGDDHPQIFEPCGLDPLCRSQRPKQSGPFRSGIASPSFDNPSSYSTNLHPWWLFGDPHLITADGVSFDFMAVGEFTALRSTSGDMVVQVRHVPWKDSRWVSVTPAVAVNVNGDRIMIEHGHESLLLRINSKPTVLKDRVDLSKGGFLVSEGRSYLIRWPDGSVLRVLRNVRGLDLSMGLTEGRKGTVSGLLGPFTGTQADAIVTKAGTSIQSDEIHYKRLYREYGDSWRITQAESLFDYEPGKSTKTYDDRSFPDPNPPKIPAATENSARAICERAGVPKEALAGCILDVAMTGEAGFAMTTAAAMRPLPMPIPREQAQTTTNTTSQTPSFNLKLGDHVAVDKPGKGAGRIEMAGAVDQYTFTAQAGAIVYLKAEPPCTNEHIRWELYTPANTYLGGGGVCKDLGRMVLEQAGSYTIKVFGNAMATGNYGFALNLDRK